MSHQVGEQIALALGELYGEIVALGAAIDQVEPDAAGFETLDLFMDLQIGNLRHLRAPQID